MKDSLSLLEATVWLWPVSEQGLANLAAPIWDAGKVQTFRAERQPIIVETRPTGAMVPKRRVILGVHALSFTRVLLTENDTWTTPSMLDSEMVLQVAWHPETWAGRSRGTWLRRLYRGVTLESDADADREGIELVSELRFHATQCVETSGTGSVPIGP